MEAPEPGIWSDWDICLCRRGGGDRQRDRELPRTRQHWWIYIRLVGPGCCGKISRSLRCGGEIYIVLLGRGDGGSLYWVGSAPESEAREVAGCCRGYGGSASDHFRVDERAGCDVVCFGNRAL